MTAFKGEKFEETRHLDIAEIAKLVRKDLKEAFPTYKHSVRIERYSMGQALHIHIDKTGFNRYDANDSEAIEQIKQAVKTITSVYNYEDVDYMQDIHNVHFYTNDIQVNS